MKFRPFQDWAVIERIDSEEKTAGGIIIPDTAREKPAEGIVVSIGPGRYSVEKGRLRFTATTIKPGQKVAYAEYAARDVELDGQKIILVREEDILGIYEESGLVKRESAESMERRGEPQSLKNEDPHPAVPREEKIKKAAKHESKKKTGGTGKKKISKKLKKPVKKTVKRTAKKTATKRKSGTKKKKQARK